MEVNFLSLNYETRFDAEYFKKDNLLFLNQLQKYNPQKIGSFAYVTDGIHASIDYSETSGINLISATSPRENTFDLSRNVFISESSHSANPRTAMNSGDVIISTVGTIGNCAVVDETILPANSDRHVGIIRNMDDFSPYYLSTFLLSKYGRFQALRECTGNVQLNLFLYKIREILVPKLSSIFQLEIETCIKNAHRYISQSKAAHDQAETLLLATLGIADFSPSTGPVNIKSFKDSFAVTGRLDAESYQPKYDQLRDVLESYSGGVTTIGSLAGQIANGAEVREYQEEGVAYLRVGDVKNLTIDAASVVRIDPTSAEKGLEKIDLQAGDVLVSRSGSLAITAVVEPEWADALISSHLIRLRITDERIDPYYLALFLGTLPGKMQIQQRSNGGVQPEINQPALKSILVPIPPQRAQQEIRRLILSARKLRDSSNELLDAAKRAVEIAIEQDEAAGLAYMEALT